jgi:hypothetical protein
VGVTVCAPALIDWSGAALASPTTVRGGEWAVSPSPNLGGGDNSLNGISCVSAERCIAVGEVLSMNLGEDALVESWNGSSWSILPTPVLFAPPEAGPTTASLSGVSCASSKFCVAVGRQRFSVPSPHCCEKTLTETWNGSEWTFVPSPNRDLNDSLAQVSCVSSRFCVAVGIDLRSDGGPGKTLVESWDGTEWSLVPSPNPGIEAIFNGVSCVSSKSCVAVGTVLVEPTLQSLTLVESWNGTEWSVVPSPNPGSSFNSLNGVSCVSHNRCVAVGGSASVTLVETWNGATWSIRESPNPEGSGTPRLNQVSCVSTRSCAAVGSDTTEGGPTQTLVETSNGSKWSIVPSANRASGVSYLNGVSCVWSKSCFAVGKDKATPEGPFQTLVENGEI